MKRITWRPSPKVARRLTATAITTIAGVLVTSVVIAAVSFKGQGTIEFDRVKTGKLTVTGQSDLRGVLKNTATSSPLVVADNFVVTGYLGVGGASKLLGPVYNPTSGKPVKIADNLKVTGTSDLFGVLKNTTGSVKVEDNLKVTGNLDVDGSLSAGNVTAIEENVALDRAAINAVTDMLDCVTDRAQFTTYLESGDAIDCWNLYVADTPILPPLRPEHGAGDALEPSTGTRPTLQQQVDQ